tara:strand:+ start:223 stop:324 length:102 start_codon:yes stop_codon:yes gene_type:complete
LTAGALQAAGVEVVEEKFEYGNGIDLDSRRVYY